MDDLDQFLGRLRACVTPARRIDEMLENMVLDHFGDEAVERSTARRGLLQDCRAACILLDAPLDGVELAANAPP